VTYVFSGEATSGEGQRSQATPTIPSYGFTPNTGNPQKQKSPARLQCEQKAQQQYQQAKSAAATNAWNGFKIGFGTTTAVNAAAGCAVGSGVGGALGTSIAEFTGAMSSFGGAAVGCFTGGVDAALNGLAPSILVGAISGGVSYLNDYSSATTAYNQAMQACSQIP
jgi:hypothetical protein